MSQFNIKRFFAGLCFFSGALTLSWGMRNAFGFSIDFPLATLIVFSLSGSILEALTLSGVAAWVMHWSSSFEPELAFFIALPLCVAIVRERWIPWKTLFFAFAASIAGVALFYGVTGFSAAIMEPAILAATLIGSGIWGVIAHAFFMKGYETSNQNLLRKI